MKTSEHEVKFITMWKKEDTEYHSQKLIENYQKPEQLKF